MYVAFYGELKENKSHDYIKWWRDEENVKKFKESLTEGMKFLNIYFTINQTAKHDYEIWYEVDNWAVLDKARNNKKMTALNRGVYEKMGMPIKWSLMKVFRSATDVKNPLFDD